MPDLEGLRRKFDASTYALFMGMTCEELSKGYAKIKMTVKPEFMNFENLLHGGVVSSLLDQAFGCSLNTLDQIYVAVQLNINLCQAHWLARRLLPKEKYYMLDVLSASPR